ncbi:MAG: ATP-binding protein [Crocinitomicaceae bacterium]
MIEAKLKERIKELSCLYDISKIAKSTESSVEVILQKIVNRISSAFQHENDAICELKYGEITIASQTAPKSAVTIAQNICIEKEEIGLLLIHYPANLYSETDFLDEEFMFLEKLAGEIADVIQKQRIKKLEEEYIQKFVRQDRLMVLEEITASIAHELNTPLANIFGFAEFILQSERNPQTLADAQKILNSATHASEIVKKLMYFSCELPQRIKQISLHALVEDALQLLRPTIEKAKLSVVLDSDLGDQDLLFLDAVQMTQVVFNLVSNAIMASQPSTIITIKLFKNEKEVILKVADQGIGIPKNNLARIFEPFFSTKDIGEGMGLGLSVVHGIVRSHGGQVKVESKVDKGTTFTIILPLVS